MGQAKHRTTTIRHESVEDSILEHFLSNFDKRPQEVADDIMFGVAEEWFGMDGCVKFGVSTLNNGQIIRLCRPHPF